jgi:hypothetical protein
MATPLPTEEDIIADAIAGTEQEIFDDAISQDEAENDGDTSLEEMDDVPGETEQDDESGEEPDDGGDGEETGEDEPDDPDAVSATDEEAPEPQGPVPSSRLREETLRRQAIEQERDALRAQITAFQAHLLNQQQQQRQPPQPEPAQPDVWSDPEAWAANQRAQITQEITARHVNSALAEAHEEHGDEFVAAYRSLTSLNPGDPMARAVVQRIWDAPNPGKSLMRWYGEQKILRESAGDPAAYRQRVAREIMSDPEFRKQILSDMRGEAVRGDGGRPRTSTRLPKSLNGASGSGSMHASNPDLYDDSDKSVFAYAMRP